ncbi:MAG TPA: T9SS type A sorting domain-containing protein, partial [Ignavibacteriaceae bacterium]|nr:T9SS type A sorting domain-containing protein [Ignavibacteriaceae bacterium]
FVDDLLVRDLSVVPVELTSFTAAQNGIKVILNWITGSETNNHGFEIEKRELRNGQETVWEKIAFVEGNGTTAEQVNYSFVDDNLEAGIFNYRLKQIDFDGTVFYSSVLEVDINLPTAFALNQNFPNPFNPSTNISFSLAIDSKVVIKVFNILGQEVVSLVNGKFSKGIHSITFDAGKLNSGVYLYKIEAEGIDGTNFSAVRKMILTK